MYSLLLLLLENRLIWLPINLANLFESPMLVGRQEGHLALQVLGVGGDIVRKVLVWRSKQQTTRKCLNIWNIHENSDSMKLHYSQRQCNEVVGLHHKLCWPNGRRRSGALVTKALLQRLSGETRGRAQCWCEEWIFVIVHSWWKSDDAKGIKSTFMTLERVGSCYCFV